MTYFQNRHSGDWVNGFPLIRSLATGHALAQTLYHWQLRHTSSAGRSAGDAVNVFAAASNRSSSGTTVRSWTVMGHEAREPSCLMTMWSDPMPQQISGAGDSNDSSATSIHRGSCNSYRGFSSSRNIGSKSRSSCAQYAAYASARPAPGAHESSTFRTTWIVPIMPLPKIHLARSVSPSLVFGP